MHRSAALLLAMLGGALAAGCGTSRLPNDPASFPEMTGGEPRAPGTARAVPGHTARLRPTGGSSAHGGATVYDRDNTMVVIVQLNGVAPGLYAMALHENGNCTSPNGFSTGKPWLPAGAKGLASQLLPEFTVNTEGTATMTARIRGARSGGDKGIAGRSILIYEGGRIEPIRPSVPNNVVACGVFEQSQTLF